jgi:transcriptional regulator with XRE-family HTH domain
MFLTQFRKSLGLSKRSIADALNIQSQHLRRIESCKAELTPRLETFYQQVSIESRFIASKHLPTIAQEAEHLGKEEYPLPLFKGRVEWHRYSQFLTPANACVNGRQWAWNHAVRAFSWMQEFDPAQLVMLVESEFMGWCQNNGKTTADLPEFLDVKMARQYARIYVTGVENASDLAGKTHLKAKVLNEEVLIPLEGMDLEDMPALIDKVEELTLDYLRGKD